MTLQQWAQAQKKRATDEDLKRGFQVILDAIELKDFPQSAPALAGIHRGRTLKGRDGRADLCAPELCKQRQWFDLACRIGHSIASAHQPQRVAQAVC